MKLSDRKIVGGRGRLIDLLVDNIQIYSVSNWLKFAVCGFNSGVFDYKKDKR